MDVVRAYEHADSHRLQKMTYGWERLLRLKMAYIHGCSLGIDKFRHTDRTARDHAATSSGSSRTVSRPMLHAQCPASWRGVEEKRGAQEVSHNCQGRDMLFPE